MGPFFVAQVDPKDPWDRRLHSYLKSIDPGPKIIHLMDRDLILIPVQLIRGSTQNLLNETKYWWWFFPTKWMINSRPPHLLNEFYIFPQRFISWIFVGDFFPETKTKTKKTIRFQKPSKPRPLVTSPRVELSSWHFLEEQFVALPRPPSLSRGFEKFYKVHPGIPERRAGKRITHKWWAFSTFKIFCHSEGISWRCRGCHANAVKSHIFFAFWDESKSLIWVLVGFNLSENMLVNLDIFLKEGWKFQKYLSCHHLASISSIL